MKNRKIKTIVVEDEVLLLKNIEKKITQTNSAFSVVGSAYNGQDALTLIEKDPPDVVFTDIRMPIMDGLRLTEILKERYPFILVVIVSGYDDFEYARKAIVYGVCDYLLKPIRIDELEKTLKKLEEKVLIRSSQKANSIIEAQLHRAYPLEMDEDLKQYLQNKSFGMFMACTGNLRLRAKYQADIEREQDWKEIMEMVCPVGNSFYVFKEMANVYVLLGEGCGDIKDTAEFLLKEGKNRFSDMEVNISYMEEEVPWGQLHEAFRLERQSLFGNLRIGHSGLFSDKTETKEQAPAVLSAVSQNHLQTMLNSGNTSGMNKMLLQLFEEWEKSACPQQWVEKMLHQILLLLQQNLYFSEEDYEKMFQNVFETLEMGRDLENSALLIAKELSGWVKKTQDVPSEIEEAIQQMDVYIRKHYTEAINLSELAAKYHFNHSYMTRLFKKLKGQTPIKLINSLRMADAREMLKNKELSVREISETLGFTDQHYFSRIFKEATGVTPKEYRMMEK